MGVLPIIKIDPIGIKCPFREFLDFFTSGTDLWSGPENQALLESFKTDNLSVKDIFDTYALGAIEGFTGYHSR